MKQLKCNQCGAIVSTTVPESTIIRGWIECPECAYKSSEHSAEELVQMLTDKGYVVTVKAEGETPWTF